MKAHEAEDYSGTAATIVANLGFSPLPLRRQGLTESCEPYFQFALQRPSTIAGIFEGIILYFDDTENWQSMADQQEGDANGVIVTSFVAPLPINAAQRTPVEKQDVAGIDLRDKPDEFHSTLINAAAGCEQLTTTHGASLLRTTLSARHTAAFVLQRYRDLATESVRSAHARLNDELDRAAKQLASNMLHTSAMPGVKSDPRWVMTFGWDNPQQKSAVIDSYWVAALLMAAHTEDLAGDDYVPIGADPYDNHESCWAIQFAACVLAGIEGSDAILWE